MKKILGISLLVHIFILLILAVVSYGSREPILNWLSSQIASSESVEQMVTVTQDNRVIDVIEAANDAVVSIVVTKDVPIYERYYEEYDPFGFFGGGFQVPRVRERGTEEREVGGGSGFLVSNNGLIVTNRHVVDDEEARYSAITTDGTVYDVTVVGRDRVLDIAVLQISEDEGENFPHLVFGDSRSLRLGETVIAIGNALAEFDNSVSVGVVSGLSRSITAGSPYGPSESLEEVIQTDAAINLGNSGGPLLNLAGEVVGVNVAASLGAENIAFSLPAHLVEPAVESIEKHGEVVRPFLGVRYLMIDSVVQDANALPYDYGALIVRGEEHYELAVVPGSPADKAGLEENDIILAVDGVSLKEKSLQRVLFEKSVGDTVLLLIYHEGEEKEVSVELAPIPE